MSRDYVEIVRAAYERAAAGEFSFEGYAEEFEFVTSSELPDAGTYRGEEARRWISAWLDSFDELTIEATEIIDAGDKVIAGILQRGRPPGSTKPVEGRWWHVMTFRDSLIVRSELYPQRDQALEATRAPGDPVD